MKASKHTLLKVGDVFELKPGMETYMYLPEKFVYQNKPDSEDFTLTNIRVGENIYSVSRKEVFDTSILLGEYVVETAHLTGGGTGHGPHDVYPDGWHISARKLKNGKYDPEGMIALFYQSGCFTAMNVNVPVIKTMKMSFV